MNENKKTIGNGVFITAFVIIVALSVIMIVVMKKTPKGSIARVSQNGKVLMEIDLSKENDSRLIQIDDDNGTNVIEVQKDRIRMHSADCPDKVCVSMGWIDDSVLPIVCLPHKLVIEIIEAEGK